MAKNNELQEQITYISLQLAQTLESLLDAEFPHRQRRDTLLPASFSQILELVTERVEGVQMNVNVIPLKPKSKGD